MRHGSLAQFNLVDRNLNGTVRECVVPVQHQDTKCNFQKHLDVALRDGLVTGINRAELHRKGPPYSERAQDLNESTQGPALLLNQSCTRKPRRAVRVEVTIPDRNASFVRQLATSARKRAHQERLSRSNAYAILYGRMGAR